MCRFAECAPLAVSQDSLTDWLQFIVSTVTAIATIFALWYAIKSGKESAQVNKKSVELSKKTFEESVKNRKDDAMPILNLQSTPTMSGTYLELFHLHNIGQGPMFNLIMVSPKPDGSNISHATKV